MQRKQLTIAGASLLGLVALAVLASNFLRTKPPQPSRSSSSDDEFAQGSKAKSGTFSITLTLNRGCQSKLTVARMIQPTVKES